MAEWGFIQWGIYGGREIVVLGYAPLLCSGVFGFSIVRQKDSI